MRDARFCRLHDPPPVTYICTLRLYLIKRRIRYALPEHFTTRYLDKCSKA
uniref:Uncharacterized protein n=1 Tax=Arundo donax TaxID=35708 RepID=A0A0A9EC84_ARUDO